MAIHELYHSFDVVVIGGGFSGVCAAIASARGGAKTAILQNRSVFGGTGSSEVRMHIVGANCHSSKADLRETGIIEEILLENKRRNPYCVFPIFDMILWEKVHLQENLTAFLNTNIEDVILGDDGSIKSVIGHQNTTESRITFSASLFIDATGHGTVGVMAGAANRTGSEGRAEFNEPTAPEVPNDYTMGNTIMFYAKDRGEPVPFEKPVWARTFTEADLKERPHQDQVLAQADGGGIVEKVEGKIMLPEFSNVDAGYWWIELGGDYKDIIEQGEEIRDDLLAVVYGVWDHLKNQGNHGVENYDLDWVGMVPGYRESRRLEGPYILNENDIRENRIFPDAVAYGGWPMDNHIPEGINNLALYPSRVYNFPGCYTIPYRCYISKNVPNLFMAGRDISCSKMAFSSTRVMGTCAVGGQAVGTAAALAIKYACTPASLGEEHMDELQQTLLKNDCFLPGFSNTDPLDLARTAAVTASSETEDGPAANVINGTNRPTEKGRNYWESAPIGNGQTITLTFPESVTVSEVRLTFDTDLSHEIQPTMIENVRKRQVKGLPIELVKDYSVIWEKDGKAVKELSVTGNGQRLNVLTTEPIDCDRISITVTKTHGLPVARILEIRAYR